MIPVTIGRASLYHGDCQEVLEAIALPVKIAVVTDPPYGIGIGASPRLSTSRGFDDEHWDDAPVDPQWIAELSHLYFDSVIIWGGNYYPLPPTRSWLVWDKLNAGRDFGDAELAWTNLDQVTRLFAMRPMNMDGGKVHPTQKPVALMKWCIGFLPMHTAAGRPSAILDPYMGSGSTGVAAVQRGHDFIGIERSERHFQTACRRLDDAQKQLDLFAAPTERNSATQETLPL